MHAPHSQREFSKPDIWIDRLGTDRNSDSAALPSPGLPWIAVVIALTGKLSERPNYLPNGEAAPLDESDSLFADG